MWQSLSFGANYKAAYCMSVCPAGEDVIAPFLADRSKFLADFVKPLQEKAETVYVIPSSERRGARHAPLSKEAGQASARKLASSIVTRLRARTSVDIPAGTLGRNRRDLSLLLSRGGGTRIHDPHP